MTIYLTQAYITLYQSDITKDKNFKIDDIEHFLNTQTMTGTGYLGGLKLTEKITLKFPLTFTDDIGDDNQTSFRFMGGYKKGNYLRIINNQVEQGDIISSSVYYYFVDKITWLSVGAVTLECSLDTINTYLDKLTFSKRTLVSRQHKDRLKLYKDIETISGVLQMTMGDNRPTAVQEEMFNNWIKTKQLLLLETQSTEYSYLVRLLYNIKDQGGRTILIVKRTDGIPFNEQDIDKLGNSGQLAVYPYNQYVDYIIYDSSWSFNINDYITPKTYQRVIDYLSENINPPLYGLDKGLLRDVNADNSFYLIYRNQNDPSTTTTNPVDIFICADNPIKVAYNQTKTKLTIEDVPLGETLIFGFRGSISQGNIDKSSIIGSLSNTTKTFYDTKALYTSSQTIAPPVIFENPEFTYIYNFVFYLITNVNNELVINVVSYEAYEDGYSPSGVVVDYDGTIEKLANVTASEISLSSNIHTSITGSYANTLYNFIKSLKINESIKSSELSFYNVQRGFINSKYTDYGTLPDVTTTINSISQLDRTDGQLIKVIQCPYCPFAYNKNNDIYILDEAFITGEIEQTITLKYIKVLSNDFILQSVVNTNKDSLVNNLYLGEIYASGNENKNVKYESKLFHSEFYQPKIIYDSFEYTYQLEKMQFMQVMNLSFVFTATSTINSRFLVTLNDAVFIEGLHTQAYDNLFTIERNNELPIYQNAYIDYLRTGYNYDVKAKNINTGLGYLNMATTLVNQLQPISSPKELSSRIISGATSSITAIAEAISTQKLNENALDKKVTQMKYTTTSVAGSDTVDLMTIYTGNRFKLMVWQISDYMKELLAELFYLFGYVENRYMIPDVNSRIWFNFLQCDAVFDNELGLEQELLDDIIARLKVGVTFIHKFNNQWDIKQEKENWESWLLEGGN